MIRIKKVLIVLLIFTALFTSCNNDCNCSEDWEEDTLYFTDDLVFHNDTCWICRGGGRRIEPGPFLQNGNDIWFECED